METDYWYLIDSRVRPEHACLMNCIPSIRLEFNPTEIDIHHHKSLQSNIVLSWYLFNLDLRDMSKEKQEYWRNIFTYAIEWLLMCVAQYEGMAERNGLKLKQGMGME